MRTALLLAYYFPPVQEIGGFRTLRFAKFLGENGWRPTVVAASPEPVSHQIDHNLLELVPRDLTVHRLRAFNPDRVKRRMAQLYRSNDSRQSPAIDEAAAHDRAGSSPKRGAYRVLSGAKRIASHAFDACFATPDPRVWWIPNAVRTALRVARSDRPDIVYTSGPPHSTHLAGLILNALTGIPWVADFRDPWARAPWNAGATPAWRRLLHATLERACVTRSATVILNTDSTADEFIKYYGDIAASKFVAIPNGYDPELQCVVRQMEDDTSSESVGRPVRLIHAGALYGRRSAMPIVEALAVLRRGGLVADFAQYGECGDAARLMARARSLGIEQSVQLHDKVPHREALRQMARSDILVAIQPGTGLEIPGKIYEMMLFRKPILVVADGGATTDLVVRYGLGAVAPSSNHHQIAESLRLLFQNVAAVKDDAERRARIEEFDGRGLTARLARLFDMACKPSTFTPERVCPRNVD